MSVFCKGRKSMHFGNQQAFSKHSLGWQLEHGISCILMVYQRIYERGRGTGSAYKLVAFQQRRKFCNSLGKRLQRIKAFLKAFCFFRIHSLNLRHYFLYEFLLFCSEHLGFFFWPRTFILGVKKNTEIYLFKFVLLHILFKEFKYL